MVNQAASEYFMPNALKYNLPPVIFTPQIIIILRMHSELDNRMHFFNSIIHYKASACVQIHALISFTTENKPITLNKVIQESLP